MIRQNIMMDGRNGLQHNSVRLAPHLKISPLVTLQTLVVLYGLKEEMNATLSFLYNRIVLQVYELLVLDPILETTQKPYTKIFFLVHTTLIHASSCATAAA